MANQRRVLLIILSITWLGIVLGCGGGGGRTSSGSGEIRLDDEPAVANIDSAKIYKETVENTKQAIQVARQNLLKDEGRLRKARTAKEREEINDLIAAGKEAVAGEEKLLAKLKTVAPAAYTEMKKTADGFESHGLVLLKDTVVARDHLITGVVVNRSNRKLDYVIILFNIYDSRGVLLDFVYAFSDDGKALESGGQRKFAGTSSNIDFASFKLLQLSGS